MKNSPRFRPGRINSIVALVLVTFILAVNIYSFIFGADTPEVFSITDDLSLVQVAETEPVTPAAQEPEQEDEQNETVLEEPEEPDDLEDPDEIDIPDETEAETVIRETVVTNIIETDEELTAMLEAAATRYNSVAVSLAAFEGEYDFYTYQYGFADLAAQRPVDHDTKFRVASLSKLTTSVLAMTLVDSGQLDINEDISTYLGYEVKNPHYPETAITSKMLMQHTSSIVDAADYERARSAYTSDTTRRLLDMPSMHGNRQPGTEYEYSDFGLIVLGAICEKVSDKLFDALAREVLFEPLGLDAAYVPHNLQNIGNIAAIYNSSRTLNRSVQSQLDQHTSPDLGLEHNAAHGNLTISALDYARILAMLANGGVLDGERILSEEAVREIHEADVQGTDYMQGFAVRFEEDAFKGDSVYWHTGSAYGTFAQFVYCTETKRGAVVVTTGARTERRPNGMVIACSELLELVWS